MEHKNPLTACTTYLEWEELPQPLAPNVRRGRRRRRKKRRTRRRMRRRGKVRRRMRRKVRREELFSPSTHLSLWVSHLLVMA